MEYYPVNREKGHFQHSLMLEEIVKVCSVAYSQLKNILKIKEMESGFFNNTYRITFDDSTKVILRVAPRNSELLYTHENHLMRGEYNIQPYFAVISEYIPQVIFSDFSRKHIDRDYVFQSFIEGMIWGEVQEQLSQKENESVWMQLGAIVNRLNSVSNPYFGMPYPFPSFHNWSSYFINLIENRHQDVYRFNLSDVEILDFIRLIKACIPWLDEISEAKLCHGDLWPNNIVVKQTEKGLQIVGIIDTERAYWGDPLAEWTFSNMEYPMPFWNTFGERKGGIGEEIRKLIYKGDFYVNSILESIRFKYDPPYMELNLINIQLNNMIDKQILD